MSEEIDLAVLSETFCEFLGGEWPRSKAVAYARQDALFSDVLWQQMTGLGWTALTAPEVRGGLGMGAAASAELHSALGAAAAPVPMLGSTLATYLVAKAGTDAQQASLLAGLADGTIRASVAQPANAVIDADGPILNGQLSHMLDAPLATTLFFRARRDGKRGWLALPANSAGVAITRVALADTTRTLGDVTLTGVDFAAASWLLPKDADALDNGLLQLACLALAADAIGGGEAALAGTIDYMNTREQFGRLISSFQALKHRVADHQAALVAARGLVEHAAQLAETDSDGLLAALVAKQHVTRVVAEVTRDCIQLHGGVGFTAEYFPHIFLKRAKLNEVLFGTRSVLLDRIADMLEAK